MFVSGPVAQLVLLELEGGLRRIDDDLVEGIGDWMDGCSEDGTIEAMARGMARKIIEIPGLPVFGINIPGAVAIAPHHDPAERRVTIAHELSHVPAREHGFNDCHADVQRVMLAALIPRRIVRSLRTPDVVVLAAAAGVPCWAAWARLKMSSVHAMLRVA
jgi:hypothetical protein